MPSSCQLLSVHTEIRIMIYEQVFAEVTVRIYGEESSLCIPDSEDASWLQSGSNLTVYDDACERKLRAYSIDELDKCITDKYIIDNDLELTYEDYEFSKRHNWRAPRTTYNGLQHNPAVDDDSIREACALLRTCKLVKHEAQPVLKSVTILRIESMMDLEMEDLPLNISTCRLSAIRRLELWGECDVRHGWMFDLRRLPALRELKLLGPCGNSNTHVRRISSQLGYLINGMPGDLDEMFIQEWFDQERKMYELEAEFVNQHALENIRMKLGEKNRGRYWLRDLIHNREVTPRHFRVIKRLYVTGHMCLVRPEVAQKYSGAGVYQKLHKKDVQAGMTICLCLDFDIDTRKVLWRRIWTV